MNKAAGVVLAGGRATRMDEQNKALLQVGGVPVIERVVAGLQRAVSPLVIATNDPGPLRYLGLTIIPDATPEAGPFAGLLAGLKYTGRAVLVCACDLPFVSTALAAYLVEKLPGWDAVVPRCPEGAQPLFAVYGQTCTGAVRRAVERRERRITGIYRELAVRFVEGPELAPFGPERAFFNLNTPADLAAARSMAGGELLYSDSRAYNGKDDS